ncbi:MFS transporter [Aneurinibacillus aneurinilyticus]|jgi:MFS family permease|uniref:MFS transporter n=1 Tax=Aneurinibacillus aneurinilyticus TaxID=1391 RepID=UPI0023F85284|nr:MFS transporter [Aneurinibacillus aneurinilyticus]MCI1695892.1 MFS transporter [Aneurinibacillus aneurinilyticus]
MEKNKKPVVVISIATALCLLGDSMLYIVLPIYWREAGLLSLWEVGIILSVNRFVRLPLNPLVGWLYQRISLRTGLFLAVGLGSLTTIGYGFAQGLVAWIALRTLWGAAWSLLRIGGLSAVAQCADDSNCGEMMGLYNGLYRLGSLVGMLMGGVLVALLHLKGVSILFGCMSLLGIPLVLRYFIDLTNGTHRTKKSEKSGRSTWNKRMLLVLFSGFFVSLVFQGVLTSTLSYIIQKHGQEISLLGIVLAASAWSGVLQAARWTWEPFLGVWFGRLSDGSRGRIPLYSGSLLAAASGLVLLPLPLPFAFWVVVALFVQVGATSLTTITDALATDEARHLPTASTLALYSLAQDFGAALGPITGYLFIEWSDTLHFLYIISAVLFLGIAWCWRRVTRKDLVQKHDAVSV